MGKKPILIPITYAAWHLLAHVSEFLPGPPLTRNQVELMEIDNIAGHDLPGFARLDIVPQPVEEILPEIARRLSAT
jgi:NADH dehydrogenase